MPNPNSLQDIATQIRRDTLRMVHAVQSGHPGGSLGCADFFALLFFERLRHQPEEFKMEAKGEDVFILSNGHISPAYYSALARSGYFPVEELKTFRHIHSRLQGHPTTHEHLPGVRISTGSLGQGLSVASGLALAKKMDGDKHLVYCLTGDGEIQEGQIWEAIMFAVHHKLDNLWITIDVNGRQIDGDTKDIMGFEDLTSRFEAFGCQVVHAEGNEINQLRQTMENAEKAWITGKPLVMLMKTEMGQGVDFMMGSHKWHGVAPNDEQLAQALFQLPETLGDY